MRKANTIVKHREDFRVTFHFSTSFPFLSIPSLCVSVSRLKRATDTMFGGKQVVVCGYGEVSLPRLSCLFMHYSFDRDVYMFFLRQSRENNISSPNFNQEKQKGEAEVVPCNISWSGSSRCQYLIKL